MRKKVSAVFTALVFVVLTVFLVERADAFCVYNHSDKRIHVSQVSGVSFFGGAFDKTINPGGKECCNWQEKSCNYGGKRDSDVAFDVTLPDEPGRPYICSFFVMKAGGWLTVEGGNYHYKCVAHFE